MWIERLEFTGFGSLAGSKIDFKKDQLNLVVEANEYGKSTIAEAIWAVLYDYSPYQRNTDLRLKEREARRPFSGQEFKACLDIEHEGKALRIVRDFQARTLKVFNRSEGDVDVTQQFLTGPSEDDLGLKLTGMTRDLFKNICLVEQRQLSDTSFGDDRDLSHILQSIADSSGTTTSSHAIEVIEDCLSRFPFKGKSCRADKLIRDLERKHDDLTARADLLAEESGASREDLLRLNDLDVILDSEEKASRARQYFQLTLSLAGEDARLSRGQEWLESINHLQHNLDELNTFSEFPIEREKPVDELWAQRNSRIGDYNRLKREHLTHEHDIRAKRGEIRERYHAVGEFTKEDARELARLALDMKKNLSELSDAQQRQTAEQARVQQSGIALDSLSPVRQSLLNLDAKDVDDAYAYQAMIKAAKDQIHDCERSVWKAQMVMKEIEEQRKHNIAGRKTLMTVSSALFVLAVGCLFGGYAWAHVSQPTMVWVSLPFLALLLAAITISITTVVTGDRSYRLQEYETAGSEEHSQAATGQDLHSKVLGLEIRLDDLARKAAVANGVELVKRLGGYAALAVQLKDLDLIEQTVVNRQSNLSSLKSAIEGYLLRAQRGGELPSPEAAQKLEQEIDCYLEELRMLEMQSGSLSHLEKELKLMADDIKSIESGLMDHFASAKIGETDNVEFGHKLWLRAKESFSRWEACRLKLSRAREDAALDLGAGHLVDIMANIQAKREHVLSQMQDLVSRYPEIAEFPLETVNDLETAGGSFGSTVEAELDGKRREREELLVRVRAATKNYDDNYLDLRNQIEEIGHELEMVGKAKAALELARDTFDRLAKETHGSWSSTLNQTSREMLEAIGTDFESLNFDPDLKMTARRRGQLEPLQTANINSQLSIGTREQLYLLARMAMVRFLSQNRSIPIIMDEPFSEADDDRMLKMMQFTIQTLLKEHQVIVFSCHQQRHQWLLDHLDPSDRGRISFSNLQPTGMTSDAACGL